MAIQGDKVCGIDGTALLFLFTSGSTKTARDKTRRATNTPPQTSKQATNEPRRKRASFGGSDCNPARALCVQMQRPAGQRERNEIRHARYAFRLFVALAGSPVSWQATAAIFRRSMVRSRTLAGETMDR
jgi:hypothetical protein